MDNPLGFIDCTELPVVALDASLRITQMNAAFADLFSPQDHCTIEPAGCAARLVGMENLRGQLQQALGTGDGFVTEVRFDHARYFQLHASPWRGNSGNVCGIIVWLADVSAYRAQERALRESEQRYRLMADSVTEYAIFMLDPDGRVASWNPGAQRLKGYSEEEILQQSFATFYTLEDRDADIPGKLLERARSKGRVKAEGWRLRKNGSAFYADVLITALCNTRGELAGFVKITRDATQRKCAEDALRNNEARVRRMLDAMPEAVLVVDAHGTISHANETSVSLFGFRTEELVGQPVEVLLPEKSRDRHAGFRQEYARAPKVRPLGDKKDLYALKRDGTQFPVDVALAPLLDSDANETLVSVVDISERKAAEEALKNRENYLHTLLNTASDGIHVLDRTGKLRNFSQSFSKMLGYSAEEMESMNLVDFETRLTPSEIAGTLERRIKVGETFETRYRRKDGCVLDVEINATSIELDGNTYVYAAARDVTDRKITEIEQREAASVFANTLDGVVIADGDGTILRANPACEQILGYSSREVVGQDLRILASDRESEGVHKRIWRQLHDQCRWQGEIWGQHRDGRAIPARVSISTLRNSRGNVERIIATFHDITEQKLAQDRIQRLAHYDALTGLPNRVLLADRLKQSIATADRYGKLLAVCYLDLDGFKPVNDRYGHDVGDALLVQVADRLNSIVRDVDTVARIGGDEFVVLLNNVASEEECQLALRRMQRIVAETYHVRGNAIESISVSVGITLYPTDDSDPDTLLRHADQAMYEVKQSARKSFSLFDAERNSKIIARRKLVEDTHRAIEKNELEMHFQPKVNMRTGAVVGAEALIRWNHPQRGLLKPAEFLPSLESDELAFALDNWVIRGVMRQQSRWQADGLHLTVSVNVVPHNLQSPDFVGRLRGLKSEYDDLPPTTIEIEVLESSALSDLDTVAKNINECRALGFAVALDDFGTGHASLLYLRRLPFDILKIDRSFVGDMLDDDEDLAIVQGIIGLSKAFGRNVVAEGVESEAHGSVLMQMGCVLAQGFGIAKPMNAASLPGWIHQYRQPPAWRHCSELTVSKAHLTNVS
ncbi:MAG: PAS domain S-box protein [Pseudomonadota bacterium]